MACGCSICAVRRCVRSVDVQLFIAKAYSCSGGSTHFITTQTAPPGKIASDPVSGLGVMGDREGDVWLADFGATYSYDW